MHCTHLLGIVPVLGKESSQILAVGLLVFQHGDIWEISVSQLGSRKAVTHKVLFIYKKAKIVRLQLHPALALAIEQSSDLNRRGSAS